LASSFAFAVQSVNVFLKTRPQDKQANSSSTRHTATTAHQNTAFTADHTTLTEQRDSNDTKDQAGCEEQKTAANPAGTAKQDDKAKRSHAEEDIEDNENVEVNGDEGKTPASGRRKTRPDENEAETSGKGKPPKKDRKGPSNSRRKAFITLSYIVVAYVVCWVPFHFVFDVSLARPELISADLYTAAFWLAYINSGLNPFMYAFSSADFREAVVRLVKCRFCRA